MEQKNRVEGDMYSAPDLGSLDPNGGVLVTTTYWRPRPNDPNPEQPGEKLSILSYLPTGAKDPLSLWQWQTLWRLLPTAAVLAASLSESRHAGI